MDSVFLYNTLSGSVEPLKPLTPGEVKIYCCGPTVYDYQHIGNLRTYIFEDILVKALRLAGFKVQHVMNITDVGHLVSDADEGEDKMLLASRREKKSSLEIAKYYTDIFFEDCAKLHIKKPDVVCNATDHISEMIALIQRLEQNGMTYLAGGNVYFDIAKLEDYGKLARLDIEKLKAGARIEVDSNKRSPADFVLWFTKSKFENQELQWDSPWGRGYPGWHIECSAMSMKYLGEQFDIHCGGIDHVPVHHTNEIAQSEGATGKNWVSVWMHGEFLVTDKEKMSKSKGGFLTLDKVIIEGIEPLAYRFFCLGAHYRTQLSFSWEALRGAQSGLRNLRKSVLDLKSEVGADDLNFSSDPQLASDFRAAVFNDLNMPKALAVVWKVLADPDLSAEAKLGTLYDCDQVLGLGISSWTSEAFNAPQEILDLVAERDSARRAKDWTKADELRDRIQNAGYVLHDSPNGAKVEKI